MQRGLASGALLCKFSVLGWNTSSLDYCKKRGAVDTTASMGYQSFRMDRPTMDTFVAGARQ